MVNISEDRNNSKHIICYKNLPLYYPNQFLNQKGVNSSETREAYAKILVRFFNYFEDTYGISDYRQIKSDSAMKDFMNSIIYDHVEDKSGRKKYLYENDTIISPHSANTYMSRIQSFYLTLEKPLLSLLELDSDYVEKMLSTKQKNIIRQKTIYKGIWSIIELTELDLHQNTKWKDKRKKKASFTKEEVDLIVANIKNISLRDLCIFLTCLETGARITEILTGYKRNFKKNRDGTWTLGITNSKSQKRFVAIPPYLAKIITKYINTERRRITENQQQFEFLFVSTKGLTKGDRVSYDTFRRHLKDAGEMAGLDTQSIMSHLARGTKGTRMVAEGISKEKVRIALGNKVTINPYIDYSNPELVQYSGKALYYIDEE